MSTNTKAATLYPVAFLYDARQSDVHFGFAATAAGARIIYIERYELTPDEAAALPLPTLHEVECAILGPACCQVTEEMLGPWADEIREGWMTVQSNCGQWTKLVATTWDWN